MSKCGWKRKTGWSFFLQQVTYSIFDEIFKIYMYIKKWFYFVKGILQKMSTLNNLRKMGTTLTLGEGELLAEMVRSNPCFYNKT